MREFTLIFLKILNTCFDFFGWKALDVKCHWREGLKVKFFVRFLQDAHFSCSGKISVEVIRNFTDFSIG